MNALRKITILSLNIYFDDISGKIRYPRIIEYLKRSNVDIICLQEVTDLFLSYLKNSELISAGYSVFDHGIGDYRNIIISKLTCCNNGVIALPTRLGRQAPFIDVKLSTKLLRIYSVHLESYLEDCDLRLKQLDCIFQSSLKDDLDFVICGDMNFGDEDKENETIKNIFFDHNRGNNIYTFDIEENVLASKTKFPEEKSRRIDRFLSNLELISSNYCVHKNDFSDHFAISMDLFL